MFYTIELFAGAGGLALGIEKAGFETLDILTFVPYNTIIVSMKVNRG